MDCQDKSDEYHCTQIKIDESNYLMEYVPRDPNGKDKLEVEASFVFGTGNLGLFEPLWSRPTWTMTHQSGSPQTCPITTALTKIKQ